MLTETLMEIPGKNIQRLQLNLEPADAYILEIRDIPKDSIVSNTISYIIGMIRKAIISTTISIFTLYDIRNTSREIMVIVNGDMSDERTKAKRGSLILLLSPKECLETIPGRDDAQVYVYVDYNVERGVDGSNIQRKRTRMTTLTANILEKFKVGDEVKIRYRGRKKWYEGKIEMINMDGSVDVRLLELSNVTIVPNMNAEDSICAEVCLGVNGQNSNTPGTHVKIDTEDSDSNSDYKDVGLELARIISENRSHSRRKVTSSSSSPLNIKKQFHISKQDKTQQTMQPNHDDDLHVQKVSKKENWTCKKCNQITFASWGIYCYHCNWDCILCGNTDNWGRRKACNKCQQERGTVPVSNTNPTVASMLMNASSRNETGINTSSSSDGKVITTTSPIFGIREVLSLGKTNVMASAVKGVVIYKCIDPGYSNNNIDNSCDVAGNSKRPFSAIDKTKDYSPCIYLRDVDTNDFIVVFLNGENPSFVLSSILVGIHVVIGPVKVLEAKNKKSLFLKFEKNSGIRIVGISPISQLEVIGKNSAKKPTLISYDKDIHHSPVLHTTISHLNLNQRKSRCLWNLKVSITSIDKVRVYLYCNICKKDVTAPHRECIYCRSMTNPVIKWAAELTVDDHTSVATADFEDFDVFKLLTTKVSSGIDKQKYVNFIEKCVQINGEFGVFNNLNNDMGIPDAILRSFDSYDGNITDFTKIPENIESAVSVLKILIDRISLITPLSIVGRVSMRKYDINHDGYHPSDIRFQAMYGYQYINKQTTTRPHVTFRVIYANLIA